MGRAVVELQPPKIVQTRREKAGCLSYSNARAVDLVVKVNMMQFSCAFCDGRCHLKRRPLRTGSGSGAKAAPGSNERRGSCKGN